MALGLAVVGIDGLMSYGVTVRSLEIGVRLALGARRSTVVSGIVRDGLRLTVAGLLGLVAAIAAGRAMRAMVFGVGPTAPVTYLVVAMVVLLTAILASLLPARRAARVDPSIALRSD